MSNPSISKYGWTAVPRKVSTLLQQHSTATSPAPALHLSTIELPSSPLASAVFSYAQSELPLETLHHSMRVYYYGVAILAHAFPSWASESFNETYYLTCLLHDIGTTPSNITSTLLSFEFYGAMLSHALLRSLASPVAQAENVTEAIIRHQDLGDTGTLTQIGALIQLATIFDNMGGNPELVHRGTIEEVVKLWPRLKWSSCFAVTIRRENSLKPWAHTTHLGEKEFPEGVEENTLMEAYE
ncbi:Cyanamide hydratase [Chlorociboria aeruginascens]|nr:Cyanamide hydratase [Chlorociboria aeruginascens]